jgi:hypothetical protein
MVVRLGVGASGSEEIGVVVIEAEVAAGFVVVESAVMSEAAGGVDAASRQFGEAQRSPPKSRAGKSAEGRSDEFTIQISLG